MPPLRYNPGMDAETDSPTAASASEPLPTLPCIAGPQELRIPILTKAQHPGPLPFEWWQVHWVECGPDGRIRYLSGEAVYVYPGQSFPQTAPFTGQRRHEVKGIPRQT